MKTLLTVLGVAAAGTVLIAMRKRKPRKLAFAGKCLLFGARLAALGIVGYRAVRKEATSVGETCREAADAWRDPPRLSVKLK